MSIRNLIHTLVVYTLALAIIAGVLFLLSPGSAAAKVTNMKREQMHIYCLDTDDLDGIMLEMGEVLVTVGMTGEEKDHVARLYVNPETRIWTLMVSSAQGRHCALATGEHLEHVPEVAAPKKNEPS